MTKVDLVVGGSFYCKLRSDNVVDCKLSSKIGEKKKVNLCGLLKQFLRVEQKMPPFFSSSSRI